MRSWLFRNNYFHKKMENKPIVNCPNCSEHISGKYCSNCGQKIGVQKLGMREVFDVIPTSLLLLERRYWNTIKDFFLNPGQMIIDYSEGKRKRYASPVQFFYFFGTLALILSSLTETSSEKVEVEVLGDEEFEIGSFDHMLQWSGEQLGRISDQYTNLIELGLPFIFGLLMYMFFRRKFNLAEAFAFSFILLTFILHLPYILLSPFSDNTFIQYSEVGIELALLSYFFFKIGKRRLLNIFLGYLISALTVFFFVIVLFLIAIFFYHFLH